MIEESDTSAEQRHHDEVVKMVLRTDHSGQVRKWLHYTAPLRAKKRARRRRTGTVSHRFKPIANAKMNQVDRPHPDNRVRLPLPPFDLMEVWIRKEQQIKQHGGQHEQTRP